VICFACCSTVSAQSSKNLPLHLTFLCIALHSFLQSTSWTFLHSIPLHAKGADTDQRVGQARATQKGWLSPYETCRGCVVCLLSALVVGLWWLIPVGVECSGTNAQNNNLGGGESSGSFHNVLNIILNNNILNNQDPIMIFIVLSSIFNAVAYTGGPFPLGYIGLGNLSIGYSGLGDLFVFLYFGVVATVGVPYLYLSKIGCLGIFSSNNNTNGSYDEEAIRILMQQLKPTFLHSIPIGFLATAIIVVNNLRDRHTDIHAGKRTMAVQFGERFARVEYLLFVVGSYAFCVYFWWLEKGSGSGTGKEWTFLLPLISIPLSIPQLKAVAFGGKDGQDLNEHVGGTAKLQMVYCLLMAGGLIMSSP
jgi:1,4-dihydroxy-2-naphthoate octaprenyltransferase